MNADDLDSLTLEQKQALDRYTNLFERGSLFTHIRTGWAARTASIPDLLLQAVTHLQAGLEYGITQADSGLDQSNDPYRVGKTENSDVDPAELRTAIERLEPIKKYLRGEVPVTYAKGKTTLRINFPKLFKLNGFQGLLPYFRFYPYPEWNDSLAADITHPDPREKGPFYFTNADSAFTLAGVDLVDFADNIPGLTGKVIFPDPTLGGIFPDLTNQNFWQKVDSLNLIQSRVPNSCDENYSSDMVGPLEPCKLPTSPSDLDLLVYYMGVGFF